MNVDAYELFPWNLTLGMANIGDGSVTNLSQSMVPVIWSITIVKKARASRLQLAPVGTPSLNPKIFSFLLRATLRLINLIWP